VHFGIYVHPWDIAEEGADKVVSRLSRVGIESINLAVSYHGGRFFLPHNPKFKVYNAEEGVTYFGSPKECFKNSSLKPVRSSSYRERDLLKETIDAARNIGVTVNAWTVCLHNAVFASARTDLAVENIYGEKDVNFICPVKKDSKNYVTSMIRTLGSQYDLGEIELESAFFPSGFIHGSHHEVFGVRVSPVMSFLLSTCFCADCIANAKERGFDLAFARKRAISFIQDEIMNIKNTNSPDLASSGNILDLLEEAGFGDLVSFKEEIVGNILRDYTEDATDAGTRISIVGTSMGFRANCFRFKNLAGKIKGLDLVAYFQDSKTIKNNIFEIRRELPDSVPLRAGINISYPYAFNASRLKEAVRSAVSAGSDSIIFYNYGWATDGIIDEIGNI